MLYSFLQVWMRLVLRIYFRKVFISGAHLVPADKPVILACNHPNSFLDAVLLAVLLKKPIHFLARSDVFNTPLKAWFLGKIHLIPIYRLEEGAENLHKNQDTFTKCYELLQKIGQVLIFSEGTCINEKRLRPLRKGTARLAFGAEENSDFDLDLQVVPVGINYTYPLQFRTEVMIGVAQPIPVKAYQEIYATSPARAISQLNKEIKGGLEQNMVIIDKPADEEAFEKALVSGRLALPEFYSNGWISHSRKPLETEQKIATEISTRNEAGIKQSQKNIFDPETQNPNLGKPNEFLLLLTFPLFLTGFLLNFLPLWLAKIITHKKVKVIEFYASVLMVLGMLFYVLYWLLVLFLAITFWGASGIVIAFLFPLVGYLALRWRDQYQLLVHKS